jgi:large subunit ribosomal protein L3
MAKRHNPRHGSMQVWPRKRASRIYARIRNLPGKEVVELFAGYKAGMTHVIATDARKSSTTKGEDIAVPVTIIECPSMKIVGARSYKKVGYGTGADKTLIIHQDKFTARAFGKQQKAKPEDVSTLEGDLRLLVVTQPPFKKTPEFFEIPFKGSSDELSTFIKEHPEIKVTDVYKVGDYFDARAVTTGRGFQGPVKRFGVNLRSHKSEKTIRGPGSLGGWISQQHTMYRIAHAGQTGYHQRTQYNNQIIQVGENPEEIKFAGGIHKYGDIKNPYILVRGSIPGPKKRLISLSKPLRQRRNDPAPTVQEVLK